MGDWGSLYFEIRFSGFASIVQIAQSSNRFSHPLANAAVRKFARRQIGIMPRTLAQIEQTLISHEFASPEIYRAIRQNLPCNPREYFFRSSKPRPIKHRIAFICVFRITVSENWAVEYTRPRSMGNLIGGGAKRSARLLRAERTRREFFCNPVRFHQDQRLN